MRKLILLSFFTILSLGANAYDFCVNGIYYNIDGNEATVTYKTSNREYSSDYYSGSVVIPSSVKYKGTTYTVTKIGPTAFEDCTSLRHVTIPNSVISIEGHAFKGCKNLTSIIIPSSVTGIGYGAFRRCGGLTSVTIPDSVISIESYAFADCYSLTSVFMLPYSNCNVGKDAFEGCTKLNRAEFASITNLCNITFESAKSNPLYYAHHLYIKGMEVTDLVIPDYVTSIGAYAFSGCTGLTSVTIPNSVKNIGMSAFYKCTGLTKSEFSSIESLCSINFTIDTGIISFSNPLSYAHNLYIDGEKVTNIIIPSSVTSIGSQTFRGCTELTSITIPNSVTSIGSYAFNGCTGLTSVNIPNSVTSIGNKAFYGCTGLTSIIIPNSVTAIGDTAFEGCTGLTSIIIPNSVTTIGYYAFEGCTGLTSVNIPNSVTAIESHAFEGCTGLTSVNIPTSVERIGERAFFGCTNLSSINTLNPQISIGNNAFAYTQWVSSASQSEDGCVYIGNWLYKYNANSQSSSVVIKEGTIGIRSGAFFGCTGLTSVNIPNSVTSIGDEAFHGCTGLTSVNIPNSVTSIGNKAFYGCTGLTSVNIPNSVTSIGSCAFLNCGLRSITIPVSVVDIGNRAFHGTPWLVEEQPEGAVYINNMLYIFKYQGDDSVTVSIKEGTKKICGYAFSECTKLTSITIPNSVESIGTSAFSGCTGLTSVNIPNSVESIGTSAFSGCTGLTSVNIPNSVKSIGYGAFKGCTGLTNITIPNSVTAIGDAAFEGCTGLTSIIIPNSVTTIGDAVFYGCTGLTSIIIPNSVTAIGDVAFEGCTGLTSIIIPNSVTTIGYYAFPSCTNIYVKRGTYALLALWHRNFVPFETSTHNLLQKPVIKVDATQTSATFKMDDSYSEYAYFSSDNTLIKKEYVVTDLYPEHTYTDIFTIRKSATDSKVSCDIKVEYTTDSLRPNVSIIATSPSTINVEGTYTDEDVEVGKSIISIIDSVYFEGDEHCFTGLNPDTEYFIYYCIQIGDGASYSTTERFYTSTLTLETQQPKVISEGNVIVQATSNLDDAETNVGFEWRRTDWTDDFTSNSGSGYLYEGTMEGYIRNLNTNYLWKYRPYYEASNGTRYYGEWVGIDPTNTSYFQPTVHTYASVSVDGNSVKVRGYAQRGTDNITSQGFAYWKDNISAANVRAAAPAVATIPSSANIVEVKGTVMETTLPGLDYNSTYTYVAFVTTSEGETFYGTEQTFQTGDDPTGIDDIKSDTPSRSYSVGIYDLSGRKHSTLQRGINIIRYDDGTVKKVLVK